MLTQERLKELLDYSPETGEFVWKVNRGSVQAGRRAGGVCKTWGYVFIRVNKKLWRAHHLALLYVYGTLPPPDKDVDHINRDRTDNRIANLRVVSRSANNFNTDKHKGCYFCKTTGKWKASVVSNYKSYHVGYFKTEKEATDAYRRAKEKFAQDSLNRP